MYQAISGGEESDIFTKYQPKPQKTLFNSKTAKIFGENCKTALQGLKIGVYNDWSSDCDGEMSSSFKRVVNTLRDNFGASVVDLQIPLLEEMRASHVISITSEMNSTMIPRDNNRHLHGFFFF